MLPNLIIPGAGKSGTSSLHLYLDQHPQVAMSTVKEPHFFSDPDRFAEGPGWYDQVFESSATDAAVRGESSTGYMIFPEVPERIRAIVPDCRLIFLLRNPIDRAISHYRWLVGLGLETRGFRAAFDSDRNDEPNPANDRAGNYGYIYSEGCYGAHLTRWLATFPREQLLVLTTEDLRADPLTVLNSCCEFLAVEPYSSVTPLSANETRPLQHPRLRAWLEGRDAGRSLPTRARRAAAHMVGPSVTAKLRSAAVARLGTAPMEIQIDVDRQWLHDAYSSDVELVRSAELPLLHAWREDFPA